MTHPKRAILIFPVGNLEQIETVRQRFDPLWGLIPPHITLVFPFRSSLSTRDISEHVVTACAGVAPFAISLAGPALHENRYLLLDVEQGRGQLLELHDQLYQGMLSQHRPAKDVRFPHLTIGRFDSLAESETALREVSQLNLGVHVIEAQAVIGEIIEADDSCTVELEVPLVAVDPNNIRQDAT